MSWTLILEGTGLFSTTHNKDGELLWLCHTSFLLLCANNLGKEMNHLVNFV